MTAFINYETALGVANDVYGSANFTVHGVIPDGWQFDRSLDGSGDSPGEIISETGFYAYALKPAGFDDGRRILAFRGTGPNFPDLLSDVFADVADVGKAQFSVATARINSWLADNLNNGNRIELVGH